MWGLGLGLGLGLGFMLATGLSRFCKVQPFRKRYSNSLCFLGSIKQTKKMRVISILLSGKRLSIRRILIKDWQALSKEVFFETF